VTTVRTVTLSWDGIIYGNAKKRRNRQKYTMLNCYSWPMAARQSFDQSRRHFPLLIERFNNKLIRFIEYLIVGKRLSSKFYAYLI
jgi:hypothetical protein